MLKTQNDKHIKASQDISMHNLSSYIYEMTHGQALKEAESLKITEEEGELLLRSQFQI